jgi:hypothetical protein
LYENTLYRSLGHLYEFFAVRGTRDAEWKRVDDAVSKGLPQTAITNLEPIIAAALKEKAYAEAVKGIGKRSPSRAISKATSPRKRSPV